MIPTVLQRVVEHLNDSFSGKSVGLPPPTIIKGPPGSGRSWILNEVKNCLKNKLQDRYLILDIPLKLSSSGLTKTIINYELQKKTKAVPYCLIIIDNIDFLLNIPNWQSGKRPTKAIGLAAATYRQYRDVSEFRRFLIEKSERYTVLATSGSNVTFMTDPELPFYQFFNVLEIKSLENLETKRFIRGCLKGQQSRLSLLDYLDAFYTNWPESITDGKLSFCQIFVDTLLELEEKFLAEPNKMLEELIRLYFSRLSPFFNPQFNALSYSEKQIIDIMALLKENIYQSDLKSFKGNISVVLQQLRNKDIIKSNAMGHNAQYQFCSKTLKAYLRFYKRAKIHEVFRVWEPASSLYSFFPMRP